jgi:hypothetical protein
MKHAIVTLLLLGGFTALSTLEAGAVVCAAVCTVPAASRRVALRSFDVLSMGLRSSVPAMRVLGSHGAGSLSAVD